MSGEDERIDRRAPTDRESPIGQPVVRGDASVTGERAREAVQFDPADADSVGRAVRTVRSFAGDNGADDDHIFMLEGAAACAALVRAEGSYKAAAARVDGAATVAFIRKWARVHDLPEAIRRHVARGEIAPSAAKHIARVEGDARYYLAWAVLDNDLTVREVRSIASAINQGMPLERAFREHDVEPGRLTLDLPLTVYREVRRVASIEDVPPGQVVADAVATWLEEA